MNYTTKQIKNEGQVFCYRPYPAETRRQGMHPISIALRVILAAVAIAAAVIIAVQAEESNLQCWVLCKPGDYVNIRTAPGKKAPTCGYMECGDSFTTDGTSRDGWIRVLDAGESAEAWIYCGYVVTEKPEPVFESRSIAAKKRVACRRWVDGPQVESRPWLVNGSEVQVFYIAGDWAITSRGFVKSEWLEAGAL